MDPFDLRQWKGFAAAGGDLSQPAIIDQVAIDSRQISSSRNLFIALEGKRTDGHLFVEQAASLGSSYAIVKQNYRGPVPKNLTLLSVTDPLKALQEIAADYRKTLRAYFIAIAGSYGKTMTKDLLSHIISLHCKCGFSPESFNSQIGVPLTIFNLSQAHQIVLIEVGASEPGEFKSLASIVQPESLLITPLGNRPLHGLKTLSQFISELAPLTSFLCQKQGWVIAPNHPMLQPMLQHLKSPLYFWNREIRELPQVTILDRQPNEPIHYRLAFPNGESWESFLRCNEGYFIDQIQMTSKVAWILGISTQKIIEGINDYRPQPMRTEIWRSPEGAIVINDTYSSDPQSIERSLNRLQQNTVHGKRYFVFGGMNTEFDLSAKYEKVSQILSKGTINHLFLYGNYDFSHLIQTLKKSTPQLSITSHSSNQEALSAVREVLNTGDSLLIKGARKEPLEHLLKTLHESLGNNFCYIHLGTIWHNLTLLRRHLPNHTRIMAMVKAQAYGTDAIQMAKFLQECQVEMLGVSTIEEAVALRQGGVTHPIFVIAIHSQEAQKAIRWDVEVGVGDLSCLFALEREAKLKQKKINVHLHIDTGMARFGCRPEEALDLAQKIEASPFLNLVGVMTHFASAEDPESDDFTWNQIQLFREVIQQLERFGIHPYWRHAANSAGAIRFHLPDFNLVRTGLALYGLSTSEAVRMQLPLKLALSLFSRITAINLCRLGETVSYGRSYSAKREEERVAVLPIGYFDGLHRIYSNRGVVMIRGQIAPIIGKVCMDFCMVDVTDIPKAKVGDPVLIFGEDELGNQLSPEELAAKADSIGHELITCLGPRIQRLFILDESYKSH